MAVNNREGRMLRIATKVMRELERNGIEDMILLQDDEVRDWWSGVKEVERVAREKVEREEYRKRVKQEALAKLSAEEKEILGLDPEGTKSSQKKSNGWAQDLTIEWDRNVEDWEFSKTDGELVLELDNKKVFMDENGDLHVTDE